MSQPEAKPGVTIALCVAMQAVGGGLGWSLLPPLLRQISSDLKLSTSMAAIVWAAAPLGIAVAAPIGGAAVDRFGARRVAGFAMFAGALACAARAFAVGGWSLAAAMLAFGLHVGFVAPAIPKLLAGHVPLKSLGRANGLALLGYTFATALTILTARTWIAPALGGWRPAMVFAAAAMALTGLLWLLLARDRVLPSRHAALHESLALVRTPDILRLAAMQLLLFGGYLAMLGLLPRALVEAGQKASGVELAIAAWLAVAGVANLAGPWISDRLGRRRPILLAGSAIAGGALAVFAIFPGATWLLAVAALGGGAVAPLLFAIPLELPSVGPAKAGAAMGVLMLVGQAGGFLLPIATGTAAQSGGLPAALGLLALVHLALLIPAFGLSETGRATAREATAATPSLA